jgi:TolA-binding protein
MDSFILLLQLLLVVGMAIVWWNARRDLQQLATTQQTPTLKKIESVRAAVEKLLDELDQKLVAIESRIDRLASVSPADQVKKAQPHSTTIARQTAVTDMRYEQVYTLADEGVDSEEIARRTGFGSAEVEMVIGLRPSTNKL